MLLLVFEPQETLWQLEDYLRKINKGTGVGAAATAPDTSFRVEVRAAAFSIQCVQYLHPFACTFTGSSATLCWLAGSGADALAYDPAGPAPCAAHAAAFVGSPSSGLN